MSHSSSTEDDSELLRDLVAATLEKDGVLGKIKAQLRAHVYLSLEAEQTKTKAAQANPKLVSFLSSTNGRLIASLVREFLQFFDLEFSLAVFDPETNIGRDVHYRERTKLTTALGLTELTDTQAPLLSEIMRLSKVSVLKSESPTPSSISSSLHTSPPASLAEDLPSHHSTPDISLQDQHSLEAAIMGNTFHRSSTAAVKEQQQPKPQQFPSSNQLPKSLPDPGPPSSLPSPSFLSDLPPLGRSTLGDLPPLSLPPARGLGLAPLKQSKAGAAADPPLKESTNTKTSVVEPARKKSTAPNFGFDQDHVISENEDVIRRADPKKGGVVSGGDTTPDLTENIEEDLDSFLNSDLSEVNDVTKDETLANSDISLKADYVESL